MLEFGAEKNLLQGLGRREGQRHHFADKGPYNQSHGFSSSHVWMWELNNKEGWALKNCYFWIVVLEKTLESPFDSREIKPVNPEGNQTWIFIGRTDAEAPILWPPDAENLLEKTLMLGKMEGRRRGWQRKRWLHSITSSMDMNLRTVREVVENRGAWWATVHELAKSRTHLATKQQQLGRR